MRALRPLGLLLTVAVASATALSSQTTTDQLFWGTDFNARLAIVWVNNLDGEVILVGKTYRPEATHRVSVNITGQKAAGGKKKDAKLAVFGNSGAEKPIEHVLIANYPLTIRATLRVSERLPFQGKPAILKEAPPPGSSIGVFCTLTNEERTLCVAESEPRLILDRAACERLAAGSGRLDAASCADLPEVSPAANMLVLDRRGG